MNKNLKPKKGLGQHFLIDMVIVEKIINNIKESCNTPKINTIYDAEANPYIYDKIMLEIGPGKGILTEELYPIYKDKLYTIDIDLDMVNLLKAKFKKDKATTPLNIIHGDFLKYDLATLAKLHTNRTHLIDIVGNFPYNISSQIFYKILEHKDIVYNIVCMVQKEVGQRIVSMPGSKNYGIPSVLIQAFYKVEYLFDVAPAAFCPPPKVVSAVIKLQRDFNKKLACDEGFFKKIVKMAFNQRRKTLRNALKAALVGINTKEFDSLLAKRAEQLSVKDFEYLALNLKANKNGSL